MNTRRDYRILNLHDHDHQYEESGTRLMLATVDYVDDVPARYTVAAFFGNEPEDIRRKLKEARQAAKLPILKGSDFDPAKKTALQEYMEAIHRQYEERIAS